MTSSKANLFLHPVRMRIITAISTHRMTVKDIAKTMADIPLTTLYRNLNALVKGGIVQVVEENQIRGTVERVYALTTLPSLTDDDLRGMTKTDCEQAFTSFMSILMSDAKKYLEGKTDEEEIHLIQDGVVVSKIELFLSREENRRMNEQIQKLMMEAGENEPSPERRRHVFSYLVIPFEP